MDEIQSITNELEYLFLKRIAAGLRDGSIDPWTAKELATKLLSIEPFVSFDDAKLKIQEFTRDKDYLTVMKNYIDGYYEERRKNEIIEKMREHMKAGNIDQAIQAAKE